MCVCWQIVVRYRYTYSRRPRGFHIVTLGFSAKGSSDFLQVPWERESVEQRRVQLTMWGCKQTTFKSNLAEVEPLSKGVFRCR